MLKTFYYYYHLFYKNIFKDNDSYFTAKLAFTASESLFAISVIDISCAYFFCWSLNRYYMVAITVVILAYNAFFFFSTNGKKNIEENEPKLFKSHILSITITWLFFLITTSSMFWLGYVVQDLLSKCQ